MRTAEYRIQKTTWLTEDIAEDVEGVVARFNKRISEITGLDFETAELLQMGNYGVGGQESFTGFYSEPVFQLEYLGRSEFQKILETYIV